MEQNKQIKALCKRKKAAADSGVFDKDFVMTHLMEECSELIQALNKVRRKGLQDKASKDNLLEELADVYIGIREVREIILSEYKSDFLAQLTYKIQKKKNYFDKWESDML